MRSGGKLFDLHGAVRAVEAARHVAVLAALVQEIAVLVEEGGLLDGMLELGQRFGHLTAELLVQNSAPFLAAWFSQACSSAVRPGGSPWASPGWAG